MIRSDTPLIASRPQPRCGLCGQAGRSLYRDRTDQLFDTPGSWTFRKCDTEGCGLVWLDPMPTPSDIGKAYEHYYTHSQPPSMSRPSSIRRFYNRARQAYLRRRYGYEAGGSLVDTLLACVIYALPLQRHELGLWIRGLRALPQGRLLDVGCGSGDWLVAMRELGWAVEGTDPDAAATNAAAARGITAFCGFLEDRRFPSDQFDVVCLNHVIEHLASPLGTLRECHRILKPGGRLVITTPNTDSWSHRIFRSSWRGLEPPRHLYLFSRSSLSAAMRSAGFAEVSLSAGVVTSVIRESMALRSGSRRVGFMTTAGWRQLVAVGYCMLELAVVQWLPSAADCVGGVGVKPVANEKADDAR